MHKHHWKSLIFAFAMATLLSACAQPTEKPLEDACKVVPPEEPMACTMQYDPVCGCDGKTYGNACSARGAGVPEFTPGACEKDSID